MKFLNAKKFSIIALAVAFIILVATSFGLIAANAARDVTLSGSSVFFTSGNSEVWAHKDGTDSYYTMFVLKSDSDSINFRKNLAYNWYYNAGDAASDENEYPELVGREGFLSMEVGFEQNEDGAFDFEKYVIAFETQSYTQTKDGKSVNYIIFFPTDDGDKLNVLITDEEDAELDVESAVATVDFDHIKINLSKYGCDGGEYLVTINENDANAAKFVNVGGTYAKYSSSTTTPVTPLSFSAAFPEESEDVTAKMAIYNLNGQSFSLENTRESDGHYVGGTVSDDTPPVLCLDKGLAFIGYENEISFNYTVIDVITSSPSLETSYFMLTKAQVEEGNEFNAEDYSEDGKLFRVVSDSDNQYMIPHVEHYTPVNGTDYNKDIEVFDESSEVKAAVKVLLKLTDTTSTGGMSTYVMLDWYVREDYLVKVNGNNYLAVATDTDGITYTYVNGANDNLPVEGNTAWQDALTDYRKAVADAVEKQDLKAGSKNYFYLPAADGLFQDNFTAYEDMTFAVYYTNGTNSSESNKAYNELSIPLNKSGKYIFTIYATDLAGNGMYYYKEDGEKVEFSTGDIWNMYSDEGDYEGLKQYLPWFEFEVNSSEISIEDPKEQSTAYVGSTYTPDAFEINGVSYNTEYRLYRFENELYFKDFGKAMTYEEFMEMKDELVTSEKMRQYLTYIYSTSELNEEDEEYEIYSDYAWNSSSPSFVPQHANAFYLIECKVTGTEGGAQVKTAYMGIASAPKVTALKGEDTWVQDNMASIVLLCIAGVSLIGIILLLVIKPKNKGDLDEMVAQSENKKK